MPHLSWGAPPDSIAARDDSRATEPVNPALNSLDSRLLLGRVRTWIAATAALVTLALMALAPPAAQADGASAAATQAKPVCVEVRHTTYFTTQTVYVENHCWYKVEFVVRHWGRDSKCLRASPGETRYHTWTNGLHYQGTRFSCD